MKDVSSQQFGLNEAKTKLWLLSDITSVAGPDIEAAVSQLDATRQFLLEMALACRSDEFIGYGSGVLEGGWSVPSVLVNRLRAYQCGTGPMKGLFGEQMDPSKKY